MPDLPRISVVMPVRNAGPYLEASVGSILSQTAEDIELVVVDDGSTDGSVDLLRQFARRDPRIRLSQSPRRLGVSGSSNAVVREARAPIVARMDADDVAHPERLERQYGVLARDRGVVLVGALCEGIDASGRTVRPRDRWRLVRASLFPPFPHGSVMFRRSDFERTGGYRDACASWEDMDLFLRFSRLGRVVVLPDVLYFYRYHSSNSCGAAPVDLAAQVAAVRRRCLAEFAAGRDYTELLAQDPPGSRSGNAEALYQKAAMRLWAGEAPGILPLVWQRPMDLRARTLFTLVMAAWGGLSPSTLKWTLARFIAARDWLAGWWIEEGRPCDWRLT